jgi:hypothetical protein
MSQTASQLVSIEFLSWINEQLSLEAERRGVRRPRRRPRPQGGWEPEPMRSGAPGRIVSNAAGYVGAALWAISVIALVCWN